MIYACDGRQNGNPLSAKKFAEKEVVPTRGERLRIMDHDLTLLSSLLSTKKCISGNKGGREIDDPKGT